MMKNMLLHALWQLIILGTLIFGKPVRIVQCAKTSFLISSVIMDWDPLWEAIADDWSEYAPAFSMVLRQPFMFGVLILGKIYPSEHECVGLKFWGWSFKEVPDDAEHAPALCWSSTSFPWEPFWLPRPQCNASVFHDFLTCDRPTTLSRSGRGHVQARPENLRL